MEKILDLFPSLANSAVHAEVLQDFMQSCNEHQAFLTRESHAVQPFISHINNQLNDPAHRLEGLVLLDVFLPQCSDQQFVDHGISWMCQCVKGIESALSSELNETAYKVLKLLLEMSSNFNELNKSVNSSIIFKFSENLKKPAMKINVQAAALDCIKVMLSNYGAASKNQREAFETFILQFADCKDAGVVSTAARCFAVLPLAGSSATSANHKARWLAQQRQTCFSLRELLNQLFENIKEGDGFLLGECGEKLPLESLTSMDPVLRVYQIADRLNNLTVYLGAMLTGAFPVAKSVLPDLILGIICRGLGVNCSTLGTIATNELLAISAVLPGIHVALLALLRSLIRCLGKNLYPYGKIISKLTLQSLKWTHTTEKRYGVVRRYANVRVAACNTLALWLATAKCGSGVGSYADDLFDVLVVDVKTERTTIKLTVQPGKKGTKRKELKAVETETAAISNVRSKLRNQTANEQPCLAALDLLYWLFHSSAVELKPTLHKAIQEIALSVAFDIQRSSQVDLPIPYASRECRLGLYKLITAVTLNPHTIWPPPIQYSLEVLGRGQSDDCKEVSAYCSAALVQVEKVIHPAAKTLEFPVSLEDMLKACEIDPKKVGREIQDVVEIREALHIDPKKVGREQEVIDIRDTLLVTAERDAKSLKRSVSLEKKEEVKKFRHEDECIELSSDEDAFGTGIDCIELNDSVISLKTSRLPQDLLLPQLEDDGKGEKSKVEVPKSPSVSQQGLDLESEIEQIVLEGDEDDNSIISSNSVLVNGAAAKRKIANIPLAKPVSKKKQQPAKKAQKPTVEAHVAKENGNKSPKKGGKAQGGPTTADLQSLEGLTDQEIVNLIADDGIFPIE